ncbi:MAG: hypothetical protein NZO16_05250, partial [Deltaproteobacteria bacterium]|nr:hypothetical protein [Deltaproteobacteria bacterium]
EVARRLLESVSTPFLIVAGEQIRGVGRSGNSWDNVDAGFYGTFVFKRMKQELNGLSLYLGLKILKKLRLSADFASLKWPNDLLVRDTGRKFAGILIEACEKDLLVGVGLNIQCSGPYGSLQDFGLSFSYVNLCQILESAISEGVNEFFDDFFKLPVDEILDYDYFQGRQIFIGDSDEILSPIGISPEGYLICRDSSGQIVSIISACRIRVVD